jgi:Flp pilus assembly protein TadG
MLYAVKKGLLSFDLLSRPLSRNQHSVRCGKAYTPAVRFAMEKRYRPFRLRRRSTRTHRRGAVFVELALVLPLIIFLILATIDATTMVFLNHSLTIAAYEGARVAVKPTGTSAEAITQANDFLTSRSVAGGSVAINPIDVENLAAGTHITVTASAVCDANALIPSLFYAGKSVSAHCTMVKE